MAARIDVKQEVFDYYLEISKDPDLTKIQLGDLMRSRFPEIWNPKTSSTSIIDFIKRKSHELGKPLPARKPGNKLKWVPPANRDWATQYPELILPFRPKVIVISDVHFPMHEERVMGRALNLIEQWQPHYVVWNGDFLDNAYKGHKGRRDVTAPTFAEGIHAHAEVVTAIGTLSPKSNQIFIKGNHDDKPERDTDLELPFSDWVKALWWNDKHELVPRNLEKTFYFTDRYYAIMEPQRPKKWPFTGPDNFPWIFTHQKNYGKNPLSVAQEIASIELGNMVCGHQHHLSVGMHKSGKAYICDAGTFQDPDSPRYKKERHSRHPQWGCGFLTIEHGVPSVWPAAAPKAWWDERLT